jgi:hypothetical protein
MPCIPPLAAPGDASRSDRNCTKLSKPAGFVRPQGVRVDEDRHHTQRRKIMSKFVFAYTGGSAPTSEAEGAEVMEAWMGWFGSLGEAVTDGGNPFGASTAIAADGSTRPSKAGLTGYSVVSADDLASATELAKGCPILSAGGSVEVYEALDM